jgi:acetyl-CoA acetyltransferase
MALANQVAIIGTGTIKFGENFHQSYTDMVYEAASLAMSDAGVEPGELQAG